MNFDKKFSTFLEIAETLNKHGIIPILYGSLGLYRLIGQLDKIDDIDIVVPEIYAKEKLPELLEIMSSIGYKQDKTFPHEFFKGKEQIGFELEEELKEFAGVDLSHYKATKINNVEFKEMSLADYLKFYSKALKKREVKIEKTKAKVKAIEKLLGNKKENNFAFIDSQNVYKGTKRDLGWKIDWVRLRIYLKHKYNVTNAYLFIGFIPEHNDIYDELQKAGFILKFKPVLSNGDDGVKGNVDADLVLQAMVDYNNYDRAILVSSDGDFYSLVRYLYDNRKLVAVLSPNRHKCSSLLRKSAKDKMVYMDKLEKKLAKRKGTA